MFNPREENDAQSKPHLHIVVPCYNPSDGWERTLAERFLHFQAMIPETKMLLTVVNDGSLHDVSGEKIKYLEQNIPGFKWVSYPQNMGKGYALRQGVAAAEGDYFIYTDIDFPYTLGSMKEIFETLKSGADVAAGVRESDYYADVPVRREIISKVLKKMIKYLLRIPITDTQCGLKGFNKKGREVFLKTSINRFLFDMEFLQMSFNNPALKVKPVTVFPRPDIVFSKMNYKILVKEVFNFIKLANPLNSKR
jgi:glycosyltransferase involved in cell wall biosynthesis